MAYTIESYTQAKGTTRPSLIAEQLKDCLLEAHQLAYSDSRLYLGTSLILNQDGVTIAVYDQGIKLTNT